MNYMKMEQYKNESYYALSNGQSEELKNTDDLEGKIVQIMQERVKYILQHLN